MVLFLWKGIFQLLRKNCSNLHIVFGILSLQKANFLGGFVFYCYYFIDKLPCFFYIMMALLESLFIIILLVYNNKILQVKGIQYSISTEDVR